MPTQVTQEQFYADVVDNYTDVINELVGGEVLSFSDEWFAESKNLIKPGAPIQDLAKFIPAGKWYDGWETRRHNTEEADWVIFKMGVDSAQLIGCEIDTSFFSGNYAPHISVEAATDVVGDSYNWEPVIDKVECGPTRRQFFVRPCGLTKKSYTHVRLRMYPDGGIARFRLYGKVNPVFSANSNESVDFAAVGNGGVAIKCSDQHFSRASNILLPGRGHDMSDGWETFRSRAPGHTDWVIVRLGATTVINKVVVDTAYFRGNFPQKVKVLAINTDNEKDLTPDSKWVEIVAPSKTVADKEHDFAVTDKNKYTHVILHLIPDGGVKRLRVFGTPA
jgi:allantoicase